MKERKETIISYKGFSIKRWGAFYQIVGRPGNFTWLKDAKAIIDWMIEKDKRNLNHFHL
jgi:hypothetical protein